MIQDNNDVDTIKFFEGVAECLLNDSDTIKDGKIRAKNLAEQNAQQKIVDYIRDFLEFRYLTFPDDEILAITNEIFKISNINYSMKDSGGNEMIIQSTVIAQIDDNDIINCLVRFFNERTELKSENETLNAEIDDLKSQIEPLRKENESLRKLRAKIDDLKSQIEPLRKENETLSKLRAENDSLKRQMEPLRNEYKSLGDKNDNLRRQTESLHAEINTLRKENDNFKRKMESIRTKIEYISKDEKFSLFLYDPIKRSVESLRKIISE